MGNEISLGIVISLGNHEGKVSLRYQQKTLYEAYFKCQIYCHQSINSITAASARGIACQGSAATNNDPKLSRAPGNANLQADIFAPRQAVKETDLVAKAPATTTATSQAALQIDDMGLYKPRSNIAPSTNKFDFCAPILRSKENGQMA